MNRLVRLHAHVVRCFSGSVGLTQDYLASLFRPNRCRPRRSATHPLPILFACIPILAMCAGCASNARMNPSENPLSSNLKGVVSSTANPQVALYTVTTSKPANVAVLFGPTTSYGHQTWFRPTPTGGGPVSIYVAGMLPNTTYHMRAFVQYSDGTNVLDSDHTFNSGTYDPTYFSKVTVTTTPGQTPQPGVELLNTIGSQAQIAVSDLSGNILWEYRDPTVTGKVSSWLAPKQLPNGDFVAICSPGSSTALTAPPSPTATNLVREFDLAGNTVKQITMAQLNAELAARGYNLTLLMFSHDVTPLPNGHWIVIANTYKDVVLNGQTTPTQVLGDVIVDLDTNLQPVWVWNEFDHLDVNRHPWNFPDWTHTNAVIYSPSDGDLLVSMRHQNWIVKVDYYNGAGTGNILWRLGEGGDFKLVGGTDPTDWSYAQHGINFTTEQTSGLFGLAVMDNGDDRMYPGGSTTVAQTCGVNGAPACYSTVPIYQINESNLTATLDFHQIIPPNLYNFFGGDALVLDNGDVEYDLCGLSPQGSEIAEVTDEQNPQTVWTMQLNTYMYRGYRIPSLYPGVQW